MNSNFDNKLTDIKRAENERRIKLGMLGLLIDEFPNETREKLRKKMANKMPENNTKNIGFT